MVMNAAETGEKERRAAEIGAKERPPLSILSDNLRNSLERLAGYRVIIEGINTGLSGERTANSVSARFTAPAGFPVQAGALRELFDLTTQVLNELDQLSAEVAQLKEFFPYSQDKF